MACCWPFAQLTSQRRVNPTKQPLEAITTSNKDATRGRRSMEQLWNALAPSLLSLHAIGKMNIRVSPPMTYSPATLYGHIVRNDPLTEEVALPEGFTCCLLGLFLAPSLSKLCSQFSERVHSTKKISCKKRKKMRRVFLRSFACPMGEPFLKGPRIQWSSLQGLEAWVRRAVASNESGT